MSDFPAFDDWLEPRLFWCGDDEGLRDTVRCDPEYRAYMQKWYEVQKAQHDLGKVMIRTIAPLHDAMVGLTTCFNRIGKADE